MANSTSSSHNVEASEDDVMLTLPIEIVHHILALLSYSSLANIKFLNKRCYSLWSTVLRCSGSINGLEAAMRSFLDGINASDPFRHPWHLAYNYGNGSALRATVTCSWELYLDFFRPERTTNIFHLSLETPGGYNSTDSDPDLSSFHVKNLSLKSVSSHLMSNVVSSVVSGFGYLQCLHIDQCRMNTLYVSVPELRELTISDCFQLKTVHVIAPKLVTFRFRGSRRPWFFGKGLDRTKLKDAMLDFRRGSHSKYLGSKLNLLLSAMESVECMTLFRATYEEMITSSQYARCEKLKLVNLKEIWWIDNSVDKQRINLLLSFLSICPVLEKLFITIDPNSSWSRSMVKHFDRRLIKNTGLSKLKLVKIEGCVDEDAETLLAEAISESAKTDPFIVSRTNNGAYRTYVEVASEHIDPSSRTVWSGSECAESKHAFKPIKPEVEMMILESKHAHMI